MRGTLTGTLVALLLATGLAACSDDDSDGDSSSDEAGAEASEATEEAPEVPGESVASPTEVTGPITSGTYGVPFNPLPRRLAEQYDYVEEEYFVTGTATAYAGDGTWESDGRWTATPSGSAPYTIRILVRRPADAEAFNGTVLVEWLNVTAGMDADPDFGFTHERLMEDGWGYVGVSAQKGGIEGGGGLQLPVPGFDPKPLKAWDPERYAPLTHPGDAYSYDIYSQVAQLLRRPADVDVFDGLEPATLVAAGESQSAMRMLTYVNAIHPVAGIYDGFLVHSRGNSGAPLTDDPAANPVPDLAFVRDDLDQPVLQFETETDLFLLSFHEARQEDTPMLRTWEVAGTAHADQDTLDYGIESGHEWSTQNLDFSELCGRLNEGPQGAVLRTGVTALRSWIVDGDAPAEATPIEVADGAIVRDEHGNAQGGIRTPAVDVPTATLSGERDASSSIFCSLFGSTTAFDAATLAALYPSQDAYVTAVEDSAREVVDAGFLLDDDATAFVEAAQQTPLATS